MNVDISIICISLAIHQRDISPLLSVSFPFFGAKYSRSRNIRDRKRELLYRDRTQEDDN